MRQGSRGRSRLRQTLPFCRLPYLAILAILWCIAWIWFSTEWIKRVHHNERSLTSETTIRRPQAFLPLTAYVEPIPNGYNSADTTILLPLRDHGPEALLKFTYPSIESCDDIPSKLPVFHGPQDDAIYGSNVHNTKSLYDVRLHYAATTCPVDADPFLPWIHDMFLNNDGTRIDFVAHNKRRCNTDPNVFARDIDNLEPQVTLMQPVPVRAISEQEARSLVPESLWSKSKNNNTTRYRLATSFEEATNRETRFICQFHRLLYNNDGGIQKEVLGETLSAYPYNYEFANFRKPGSKPMLTRPAVDKKHSAHNEQVWNSVLHFSCPVPKGLQLAYGQSKPTVFLDLVPIRTRPRLSREGYTPQSPPNSFDPIKEWGASHVLPEVESSGRWSNLPVCPHQSGASQERQQQQQEQQGHFLIGCTWTASSFSTRGESSKKMDTSTADRLVEWLTYHLDIAGFDHMYVYDNNSDPNTTTSSLESITNLFPGRVTRIRWPHRVCNNNKPSSPNGGERSSQYAAETSCRVRYGANADWMIFFDNDEYLIPQGKWNSIREWLIDGVGKESKSQILSFYQSRATPKVEFMEPSSSRPDCLSKLPNTTFLQTYDCESDPLPKPSIKWRAMKQIYRPSYVLNHFVHYSTVTKRIVDHPDQVSPMFIEKAPYERRVDEVNEAFMLHTKTTSVEATQGWANRCKQNTKKGCPVGVPFPSDAEKGEGNVTKDGLVYNCYNHKKVQALVPLLEAALSARLGAGRRVHGM